MNSNKIAITLLNVIIFVGLFVAIYNMFYVKKKAILNENIGVYNKYYEIKTQVDDFENIRNKMKDLEPQLEEIFSIYGDYYKTNDEIINSYTDLIKDILKQNGIGVKDSTISQEVGEGTTFRLFLSFKTSYDNLYQLLFDIERFSTISDLKVSYLGDISFRCSPNLYSSEINDYFSGRRELSMGEIESYGYFKKISDTVIEEMNIGKYTTWNDLFPVPRSPMFSGYVKKKEVAKKGGGKAVVREVIKPLPETRLEGVMYDASVPIAIIDGKLLKVGSVHKGAKVVRINKNDVDLEYYGKIYKLKMAN